MSSSVSEQSIVSGSQLTTEQIEYLNDYLSTLEPKEILAWAIDHLPNLYQTTAFGLTGLVALDMIHQISVERQQAHSVPLVFLDTMYHFQETLDLADRCQATYQVRVQTYTPMKVSTREEFEKAYGEKLWETDEDAYDYLIKVEPARRAYEECQVRSVITGRRRSQKGDRASIPVLEVDSTGMIKLNPLAYWDFQQVWAYIRANKVPYNVLVDQGYRSIGDWHSTHTPTHGEERSGRWSGQQKTECGLHKDYFKMRAAFMASKEKAESQNVVAA